MREKTVMDMTHREFDRWASEFVIDGFLKDGLKGVQTNVKTIIGQQAMIFNQNGGFQADSPSPRRQFRQID